MGYQKFPECAARVLADTELAIPALTEALRASASRRTRRLPKRIAERKRAVGEISAKTPRQVARGSARGLGRLADHAAAPRHGSVGADQERGLGAHHAGLRELGAEAVADFDKPYRWPGKPLGTGTQIGMAIGVALAHRGKGRLVVDCQTDGDLMFDAGALWFAAKHKIPLLCVMHNNRAYYNDWEHQITVARQRDTPVERAYIGMDIDGPAPDFATLARSHGLVRGRPDRQARRHRRRAQARHRRSEEGQARARRHHHAASR